MAQTDAKVLLGRLHAGEGKLREGKQEKGEDVFESCVGTNQRTSVCSQAAVSDSGDAEEVHDTLETPSKVIDPEVYSIESELGHGAFGAVFLVRHKDTGKKYAMKVMDKRKYTKNDMMSYALREKNVHNEIRHPFIVGLHHSFQTKTRLVMLLQYCSGGTLGELVKQRNMLPEALSRFYVAEVLLAVCYLHQHHLVHRDIKPANVLLDENRHALLTDFGLSKEEVENNPNGLRSFAGTLHYLAPEILARRGHNRMVDIYNLGTLAFELMTGWTPFYCEDKTRLKKNVLEAELVCPKYFSKPATDFIQATLAKDPSTRVGADNTEDLKEQPWFQELDFDALLQHKVNPPELPTLPRTVSKKRNRASTAGAGRSPFAGDDRENLSEHRIEDWDFTGDSFQPLTRRAAAAGRPRVGSRASCLFMPFLCVSKSERRA